MTELSAVDRRSSLLIRKGSSVAAGLIKELDDFDAKYQLGQKLGAGRFAQVFAAADKTCARQRITLRIFAKTKCKLGDFLREYNASYFLSPHPNIVDTYEGVYATGDFYFFAQEDQPVRNSLRELVDAGSLGHNVAESTTTTTVWSAPSSRLSVSGAQMAAGTSGSTSAGGSPLFATTGSSCRTAVKDCSIVRKIIAQVVSAVEFMHNEKLVHQNLTAENVVVFDTRPDGSWKTKITDFGCTRQKGILAKRRAEDDEDAWILLYRAPELCDTLPKEGYCVDPAQDIWSLGILVYFALKGTYPWPQASIIHKSFYDWDQYTRRKTHQLPPKWSPFSRSKTNKRSKQLEETRNRKKQLKEIN
uniref:Protein kinase domain-containing protein n=1 Tax=Romanomermis culicivorax TaxID=13658 RepID=A0A915L1Q5_ROMCU